VSHGDLPFVKMEGCQNDYVVVRHEDHPALAEQALPALARAACDRRRGVGADGLLVVGPADNADFRMRMFNVDGSEAEMCGNGLRCALRFAVEAGLVAGNGPFAVQTGAGVLAGDVLGRDDDSWDVRLDMGPPQLERPLLPMTGAPGRVVEEPLVLDAATVAVTVVGMGNPHAIVFVDDVDGTDVAGLGACIETDARFPERTNVEFVEVLDRGHVRQRTWERGCGETLACGTGACAVAVAGVLTGRTERSVAIQLRGGNLAVTWRPDDHVELRGPARRAYAGTWPSSANGGRS
jgi:diaminopimelate epimerase